MMATYNGEKYIRAQLDSIINQTYNDWTLFISDDGSTDDTIEIICEYSNKYPDKIIILNKDRIGGAKKNFIYIYNNCPSTELYMFSDQDDVWLPDKVKKMVDMYDEASKENSLIYCDLKVVDSDLNFVSDTFIFDLHYSKKKEFLLMNNYIPGCVMMIDDKMKSAIGIIPQECIMHDWWIVMYATYLGNIISVDEKLHLYRQHEKNAIGASQYRLTKDDNKKAINRLKSRKNQNNSFLNHFKDMLEPNDIKLFGRFNRMCKMKKNLKIVAIFIMHFRTNCIKDNYIYLKNLYNNSI